MADGTGYRLPRTAVPHRYRIELAPDLDKFTFTGTASIDIEVTEPVEEIVLNAAELKVSSAKIAGAKGSTVVAEAHTDEESERLTLRLPERLAAGKATVELEFTGELNDKLRGFYRSTWTDDAGNERIIASTQFEPVDARRAFPCWDEPDLKATFEVSLIVADGLTAISNGHVVGEEKVSGGRRRVRFAETMPMSTYLVACVVGPFELTEPTDVAGTPMRVATVPGKQHMTRLAIDTGAHALRYFSDYFGIRYPHDKLDHVAIPDFAMGAMENLGCVTYRETALLADPDSASQVEQRRVAQVICHETAHMWFGDLVTMKWWNGIWLNEAFATLMEVKATDSFRPDWDVWTSFSAVRAAAFAVDGLKATRPIEFPVGPPSEAEAMFDILTYEKGCAVLRMLEQYLSPEVFQRGIHDYLTAHSHGNTETTDLWDAIEAASGEPVRSIMDSWIFQGGHPLVKAGLDGSGKLKLSQSRFLYSGSESDDETPEWEIPVNIRACVDGTVRRTRVLLKGPSTEVDLGGGSVDWVVVNDGGWGFYRVHYEPDLAAKLPAALESTNALERLALAGDTWAAVVADQADLASWARLAEELARHEDDPDVWSALLGPLEMLDLVATDSERDAVAAFARHLAGPTLARLGWDSSEGDDARLALTRARLVSSLGTVGADKQVRAEAARRLQDDWDGKKALAPDLATPIVHIVARHADTKLYEKLANKAETAGTPQEKVRYLYALIQPEDEALLRRTLDSCLTDEVRTQDAPMAIGAALGKRSSGEVTLTWLEKHWDEAVSRFAPNMHVRMLEGMTSLVEPRLAERARSFAREHKVANAEARMAQLVERLEVNEAFAARHRGKLSGPLSVSGAAGQESGSTSAKRGSET